MPIITLPHTFEAPYDTVVVDEGFYQKSHSVETAIFAENPPLNSFSSRDLGTFKLKGNFVVGVNYPSSLKQEFLFKGVFNFFVKTPERKRLGITLFRSMDNSELQTNYDVDFKSLRGWRSRGGNCGITSSFIVYIDTPNIMEEEPNYSKELWSFFGGFGIVIPFLRIDKKRKKTITNPLDGTIIEQEGGKYDITRNFKTGIILTANKVYRISVGTSLTITSRVKRCNVSGDFSDVWKLKKIRLWLY